MQEQIGNCSVPCGEETVAYLEMDTYYGEVVGYSADGVRLLGEVVFSMGDTLSDKWELYVK